MIWLPLVFLIGLGFLITSISGAPWVPARAKDLDALMRDCKLKSGSVFVELGCGDGRLVLAAARRGSVATGYELNPVLWLIAYLRCLGQKNAHARLRNFWSQDLSSADVVMAFLVPRTVGRLEKKLQEEMKPGSRAISYIFELPSKKPTRKRHHWFIYSY